LEEEAAVVGRGVGGVFFSRKDIMELDEKDLVEAFVKGSGRGGQKVNKTNSCVQLVHLPTGTRVKCQFSRSLTANRARARTIMRQRLEELLLGAQSRTQIKARKERKKKDRNRRRRAAKNKEEDEGEEDAEEGEADEEGVTLITVQPTHVKKDQAGSAPSSMPAAAASISPSAGLAPAAAAAASSASSSLGAATTTAGQQYSDSTGPTAVSPTKQKKQKRVKVPRTIEEVQAAAAAAAAASRNS
jgi:hypothetical protein